MHLDLSHVPLAFLNLEPWVIAVIIPVVSLIFIGVVVVSGMYFQNRRREMWHQTARIALEKGQPLPLLPDEQSARPSTPPAEESRNDLRGGLVLIGTGIGLYLFLGTFISPGLGYVGAIPGFIGVALIISWFARPRTDKDTSTNSGRSAQS